MYLWCAYINIYIYIYRRLYVCTPSMYLNRNTLLYQCQVGTAEKGYWVSEDLLLLGGSHFFPIYSQLNWESALQPYPETAVVTPFWKHCAFQLLHVEATRFDRFLFTGFLTADNQPRHGKDLD